MSVFNRHITLFTANQVSPHTARAYGSELRRFMDHAGVDAPDLTIEHILDYRNALVGRASATIAWKISIIRSFLSFLVQERIISYNPALRPHRSFPAAALTTAL